MTVSSHCKFFAAKPPSNKAKFKLCSPPFYFILVRKPAWLEAMSSPDRGKFQEGLGREEKTCA